MAHPVFISYARRASQKQAEALHQALGGREGLAFLDSSGIEPTERFPRVLADALLGARVVVLFASKDYFRRWYCLWELEAALGPFLALGPTATEAQKEATLAPLLVVLPEQGSAVPELSSLPPALQVSHWPTANELERVVDMVRASLARVPQTLQERLTEVGQSGAALRTRLLEEAALPPPGSLASHPVSPRALAPSLGGSFVGRADDLWRIHYTLTVLRDLRGEGVAGAALTGALHGAGGFGKTRLALEYLYRFGPKHHRGGLFWVNAEVGPERLEEQFHGILRTLRPDEVPDLVKFRESQRNAAREMAEALEHVAARERVLYVVDNVPEPGPGERPKPLETWCPAIGRVSLLATSRAKLHLGTEGVHELPVFTLSPGASVELLTEGMDRSALDDAGWQRIAEWVGHLPLALELLNRTLKAGALEPRELLSRARSHGPTGELDRQMKLLERHVPPKSLRGVTQAFSLSYARLSKVEQRAARLIAQLAPEPIPVELVEALGPEVLPPDVRATLRTRHFVTSVEAAGEVHMFGGMHRVLADYLRGQSHGLVSELRQVCEGLLVLITPSACMDPKAWPLLKACLPHAERVFEQLMQLGRPSRFQKLLSRFGRPMNALAEFELGVALGHFLSASGRADHARRFEERVVEYGVRILGPDHPYTLVAMNNFANTLRLQGDLKGAREQQERVLKMFIRMAGEENPYTLMAMSNLAETLRDQGDLQGARALQEQVLEVFGQMFGDAHPDTLLAMNNLAGTLHMQGDWQGARVLEEQVLEGRRHLLGEEHLDTLVAMGNLAGTLHAQGNLQRARALEERVLEGRRQLLGEEHPDTRLAMHNLATTLRDQGDVAGAEALEKEARELRQRQK
ncbi:MAG TPA: tetratricopeptide repeat protein [Archangium sp.]|nr:tetratricopeptide repeat protein [Archangium sp.]